MAQDQEPRGMECVYLTNEQIQRLAALSLDSLVGIQIRTDASDQSYAVVDTVRIDNPNESRHFVIYTDGSHRETT